MLDSGDIKAATPRGVSPPRISIPVTRPEGYTATLSLIPSFGACTKSCFVPR